MSLHIEKIRIPVRLAQPHLDPRDGWFLLFPRIAGEQRPETVLELLNSSRSVIPFIEADEGSVLLLTRTNIDWVAVGSGAPEHLILPPGAPATHEQAVQLRFVDESRVDAVIGWRAEGDRTRLSDFLDASGPFIAVGAGFGTLIVNKQRIRETRITIVAPSEGDSLASPARRIQAGPR